MSTYHARARPRLPGSLADPKHSTRPPTVCPTDIPPIRTQFSTQPSGLMLHGAPEEGHSLSSLAWLAVKGKPCPHVFQTPLS